VKRSRWIVGIAVVMLVAGGVITRPSPLPANALDALTGDAVRGQSTFAIAGCASCHATKDGPRDVLSGGKAFVTQFGTFYAPNISSDPVAGIGSWSDLDIASAIMRGVSQDGQHLFPAFPYASYRKADLQDIADLIAYLRGLPASGAPSRAHDVGFPFNVRAAIGGWKLLFSNPDWVLTQAPTAQLERGRYLAESLGHCGECHTPRNALGGIERDRWLSGAPNPSGEGRIPNITPGGLSWSEQDIAEYLKSGFTPEFDTAGGDMAEVVENTATLSDADRLAIAAYLKAVPPITPAK
jgi:mono/diheme cytochrome c family protein